MTKWRPHLVKLDGRTCSRDLEDSNYQQWQANLQEAHGKESAAWCLCRIDRTPVPMTVHKRGGRFFIWGLKNTGTLHHPECDSYSCINEDAKKAYTAGTIRERADGKVVYKLNVPMSTLRVFEEPRDEDANPPRTGAKSPKPPSMTMRGLLNELWALAELNVWQVKDVGKRRLSRVYERLAQSLEGRIIGNDDAAQRIFIPPPIIDISDEKKKARDREIILDINARLARLEEMYGPRQQGTLFLVDELFGIGGNAGNPTLRLRSLPFDIPVWIKPRLLDVLRHQWPAAFKRAELRATEKQGAGSDQRPNRIFLIIGAQKGYSKGMNWKVGAAMETTWDFIPVDSQYEAQVANDLIAQGRYFKKPMRYDAALEAFPDFTLIDTGTDVPMEVYGFSSPEYNQRKAEKIAKYRDSGRPFWHWDLSERSDPPPFPDKVSYAHNL